MSRAKDLTGLRFGRLVAVRRNGRNARNYALWLCSCDCGSEATVAYAELAKGRTKSCGCIRREHAASNFRTHGKSSTGAFRSWSKAKDRCHNPSHPAYSKYGGAGIVMCDEWKNSFEAFYEHMGDRPKGKTLDRIDNSKGYEPGNCRWASKKLQSRNSKWPKLITYNGQTKNLSEWARSLGMKKDAVRTRIVQLGWAPEDAVTKPPRKFKGLSQR